jgi:CHASE2 domain-containing sensor protein
MASRVSAARIHGLIGLVGVLAVAMLIYLPNSLPWILPAEHWSADWRTVLFSGRLNRPQHPNLAIVVIDDDVLRSAGISDMRQARGLLGKLVTAVDAAGPRAIGIDFYFMKETDAAKTQELIGAIKAATAPVILGAAEPPIEMRASEQDYQRWFISQANRPAGFINLRYEAEDKVVRYFPSPASDGSPESFALLLARAGGSQADATPGRRISWLLPPRRGLSAWLPQKDDDKRAFLTVRAQRLLQPEVTIETGSIAGGDLKDRVVLIGADLPRADKHYTPFSVWTGQKMPGVYIHAHMAAALLDQRAVTELDPVSVRYLLFAVALVGGLIGWFYTQSLLIEFLSWTIGLIAFIVADALVFALWQVTLPTMLAGIVWFLAVTAGRSLHLYRVGAAPNGG